MTSEMREIATLAGGCFWCMDAAYHDVDGILATSVGFTGGRTENPTYEQVGRGDTGHFEAINIEFDPARVSYEKILEIFWRTIDPTQGDGQFADHGSQYQTAIFYHDDAQRETAEKTKTILAESGKFQDPIVTKILPASKFYEAPDYHQDYYLKNPTHYNMYKVGSGRAGFLKKTWGEDEHK